MTVKNADMPAMPQSATENGYGCNYTDDFNGQVPVGLTKREIFAMHAMQAQISAMGSNEAMEMFTSAMIERDIDLGNPEKLVAINACFYADALLEELEK